MRRLQHSSPCVDFFKYYSHVWHQLADHDKVHVVRVLHPHSYTERSHKVERQRHHQQVPNIQRARKQQWNESWQHDKALQHDPKHAPGHCDERFHALGHVHAEDGSRECLVQLIQPPVSTNVNVRGHVAFFAPSRCASGCASRRVAPLSLPYANPLTPTTTNYKTQNSPAFLETARRDDLLWRVKAKECLCAPK